MWVQTTYFQAQNKHPKKQKKFKKTRGCGMHIHTLYGSNNKMLDRCWNTGLGCGMSVARWPTQGQQREWRSRWRENWQSNILIQTGKWSGSDILSQAGRQSDVISQIGTWSNILIQVGRQNGSDILSWAGRQSNVLSQAGRENGNILSWAGRQSNVFSWATMQSDILTWAGSRSGSNILNQAGRWSNVLSQAGRQNGNDILSWAGCEAISSAKQEGGAISSAGQGNRVRSSAEQEDGATFLARCNLLHPFLVKLSVTNWTSKGGCNCSK